MIENPDLMDPDPGDPKYSDQEHCTIVFMKDSDAMGDNR
jgi:hypothetical protein